MTLDEYLEHADPHEYDHDCHASPEDCCVCNKEINDDHENNIRKDNK